MVSVSVIGPKVHEFKPGRADRFYSQHAFLRRGSKAEAPCSEILRHVKITSKYEQRHFERQIDHFIRHLPPDLILDDCW
jgi:hypothetical protein